MEVSAQNSNSSVAVIPDVLTPDVAMQAVEEVGGSSDDEKFVTAGSDAAGAEEAQVASGKQQWE